MDYKALGKSIENFFKEISDTLEGVLFYKIPIWGEGCQNFTDIFKESGCESVQQIPLVVLWLIVGGIFFTFRLNFVNLRMFRHGIDVVSGKYSKDSDPGQISHFQALSAAVSATVGLGNIAGVAFAVAIGGPGAVIWMMIAGFMGMSLKFAEVTLGQKYRTIDEDGKVQGGAFNYLERGLKELNLRRLGKFLAIIFAVACLGGAFGAGNLFQSNQSVKMLSSTFGASEQIKFIVSMMLAVCIGIVLFGGIRRIANVASKIVPFMAIIYITAAIVVLVSNYALIPDAVIAMFKGAFTDDAFKGGLIGAIIAGFQRAAFSNEAGLGSAPIAHSAAKTTEPVREGCVALLEPFIDTIVICFMTGLIITVTGVYANPGENIDGVLLTSMAFATVIDWFPYVLTLCIVLFAFSTMITWSYYGEIAWQYLFGKKLISLYHLIFVAIVFAGGVVKDAGLILGLSDMLLFTMAIPNIIGLYLLSNKISADLKSYQHKLASGKFEK